MGKENPKRRGPSQFSVSFPFFFVFRWVEETDRSARARFPLFFHHLHQHHRQLTKPFSAGKVPDLRALFEFLSLSLSISLVLTQLPPRLLRPAVVVGIHTLTATDFITQTAGQRAKCPVFQCPGPDQTGPSQLLVSSAILLRQYFEVSLRLFVSSHFRCGRPLAERVNQDDRLI